MSFKFRCLTLFMCSVIGLCAFTSCKKNNDKTTSDSSVESSELPIFSGETNDVDSTNSKSGSSESSSVGGTSQPNKNENKQPSNGKDTKVRDLKGRTITYLTYWAEPVKGTDEKANAYWKAKKEVEEKFNCKFVFKFSTDFTANLANSIMAGKPMCDIFSMPYGNFWSFAKQDLLYPVSELKQFDFSEGKWWKPGSEFANIDGKQYAMYASGGEIGSVIAYNKDMFSSKKQPDLYKLQKDGTLTWNKIFDISKNLTGGGKHGIACGMFNTNMMEIMMRAYGGKAAVRDGNKIKFGSTINSKETIQAFGDFQKLLNVDKSFCPSNGDYMYFQNQFVDGKIGILVNPSPQDVVVKAKFNVGFCLIPSGGSLTKFKPFIDASDGVLSAIPSSADKPEEIALIWDIMSSKTGNVNWEILFQDYVEPEVMECFRGYVGLVNKGQYTIDYGPSLYGLFENGNIMYDTLNGIGNGNVTPAAGVQSLTKIYDAKIKELNK